MRSAESVRQSEFTSVSSREWVYQSGFTRVSARKWVHQSAFTGVSSPEWVPQSEFTRVSSPEWVHPAPYTHLTLPTNLRFYDSLALASRRKYHLQVCMSFLCMYLGLYYRDSLFFNFFFRVSFVRKAIHIDIFRQLSVSIDFAPCNNGLMTIYEQDVDIIGNVQKSFSNVGKTGQALALLIGFIAGYMCRGFTSY